MESKRTRYRGTTRLYDMRPSGAMYENWACTAEGTTRESIQADRRMTERERALMLAVLRLERMYRGRVPRGAVVLDEQLTSGYLKLGDFKGGERRVRVQEAAQFMDVLSSDRYSREEVVQTFHDLHAAGLFLLDDKGVLRLADGFFASPPIEDKCAQEG